MKFQSQFRVVMLLMLSVVFCAIYTACGSSKPTQITYIEYPSFFNSANEYKTIVVGPVENAVDPEKYNQLVATNLAVKVQTNGAYKVIDATKGNPTEEELLEKGRAKDPNAIIMTSTITNYGEIRSSDLGSIGIYDSQSSSASVRESASASRNGAHYSYGASASESRKSVSLPVLSFNRAMYAKLNITLKRAIDDEVIQSNMVYAIASESGLFGLNMSESEEVLKRAFDDLSTNAVYYVAPSVETMKIDPKKVLLVQKYGKEDWENSTKFTTSDTVRIVFVISPRVAFNDFIVELKAEGIAEPLDSHLINYSGAAFVFDYQASDILALSGGAEKYTVKLIKDGSAISTQKFKIVQK